nr:alpha/beta fold hydrolase [Kribbella italica]
MTVPLDYGNPKGRTIQLGVLKVAATGEPKGSLVVNPGGPASSGMSFAAQLKDFKGYPRIARQFDVVGFDMRGTGASTPSVDCLTDAERRNDLLMAINLFGGETWTENETRRVAASCADGSGGADVISHLGSRDTARDMDLLRAVLGDEQLNYFGFSYGTRLGAVYAQTFPGKVRTMVLDGAMDPRLGIEKRMVDQYAGFQQAFDALATDCARAAGCPLGTDPAKATSRFQQLVRPLLDRPLPVGTDRRLTYRGAVEAVLFGLYHSTDWPTVVKALTELAAGQGRTLLAIRDGAHELQADGRYTNMLEGAFATHCNDRERLSPQQETAMRRQMQAAAPFLDDGRNRQARDICEHWPAGPSLTYPYVTDTDGLPPTLVVSVTGDPASPHQHGIGLAKTLGAGLLTVDGKQHGAALVAGNDCVDSIVATYLIDAKAAPADAHCAL